MDQEQAFLDAIRRAPADDAIRLVYADWLEDQGDERAMFLRVHLKLRNLAPDHPQRDDLEHTLSGWRQGKSHEWLKIAEPERAHLYGPLTKRARCTCMQSEQNRKWPTLELHREPQDTACAPWRRLCELIEQAATDGRTEFAPFREFAGDERDQIVTLPRSIAKLKAVEHLELYGSSLVRIPPEIGEMTNLLQFRPYTSYRLHWFPYEITRCPNLSSSTISTRALYGNFKHRMPFPALGNATVIEPVSRSCSVCGEKFLDREEYRLWISQTVATDVVPLLVNACSQACVDRLPKPPLHYVKKPHRGGPNLAQPPAGY